MTMRPRIRFGVRPLLVALAVLALAPAAAGASEQASSPGTTTSAETTTSGATSTTPAPEAPTTTSPATTTQTESAPASSTPASTTPAPATPSEGAPVEATPQVRTQHTQGSTAGSTAAPHAHKKSQGSSGNAGGEHDEQGESSTSGGSSAAGAPGKRHAPAPSALTPALPLTLGSPISGVSGFFIESFQVPPFLLPIYQAAGTAYGIPWQVLAAINQVETDYGRDLSVSSAGAEGWMQFLPAEWAQYGVDANGDGFKDPYNPADAIFTAARYLKAAGGDSDIRGAVFSYNHSQAYVESVMLRAQLLGGTPSELLGAVTGLTESRFPVHAASHYSDGFASAPTSGTSTAATAGAPKTLVGTTIYSQQGAPAIAVQDGEIVGLGETPSLGRYVALRDAYGNTYIYAELGSVATLYPVLEPHEHTAVSSRIAAASSSNESAPSGPASAGAQPRSPLSEGATVSGLALGAAAGLESLPAAPATPPAASASATPSTPASTPREFRSGADDVYLHPLSVGVQVLAGTVLGHLGAGTSTPGSTGTATGTGAGEPHMLFQIRPAGTGAPLIDPKPILDGWVQLENTSIFRAKGENPFLGNSPTVGQVLLESKEQLEQQVLSDSGIHLPACGRQDVQTGQIDRRVLATLEFLSVSGLHPSVSSLRCSHVAAAAAANAAETSAGDTIAITAINGIQLAGGQGLGSIAEIAVRKLLTLQGTMKPSEIVSTRSYPGTDNTVAEPSQGNEIRVEFAPLQGQNLGGARARSADVLNSEITPAQWVQLIARLGEIPDPKVSSGPSSAAIPDHPGAGTTAGSSAGAPSTSSTGSSSSAGAPAGSSSEGGAG
jgi:Transglycosylase SLT domain